MWQDNDLARLSTASPNRRSFAKPDMLGDRSAYHSETTCIAQEDTKHYHNVPALIKAGSYHSQDAYVSQSAHSGHESYMTEKTMYESTSQFQAQAVTASADFHAEIYDLGDDAESEAPSPESLASSPRSGASTPRNGLRPATPRERVQQQIALNQQKRRLRRQVRWACFIVHLATDHHGSVLSFRECHPNLWTNLDREGLLSEGMSWHIAGLGCMYGGSKSSRQRSIHIATNAACVCEMRWTKSEQDNSSSCRAQLHLQAGWCSRTRHPGLQQNRALHGRYLLPQGLLPLTGQEAALWTVHSQSRYNLPLSGMM